MDDQLNRKRAFQSSGFSEQDLLDISDGNSQLWEYTSANNICCVIEMLLEVHANLVNSRFGLFIRENMLTII